MLALEIIGWIIVFTGLFFVLSGSLGICRFRDLFSRLHAAGLVDSLGAPLTLLGCMFIDGFTMFSLKILVVMILIILTSPTACHALARAARFAALQQKQ